MPPYTRASQDAVLWFFLWLLRRPDVLALAVDSSSSSEEEKELVDAPNRATQQHYNDQHGDRQDARGRDQGAQHAGTYTSSYFFLSSLFILSLCGLFLKVKAAEFVSLSLSAFNGLLELYLVTECFCFESSTGFREPQSC